MIRMRKVKIKRFKPVKHEAKSRQMKSILKNSLAMTINGCQKVHGLSPPLKLRSPAI